MATFNNYCTITLKNKCMHYAAFKYLLIYIPLRLLVFKRDYSQRLSATLNRIHQAKIAGPVGCVVTVCNAMSSGTAMWCHQKVWCDVISNMMLSCYQQCDVINNVMWWTMWKHWKTLKTFIATVCQYNTIRCYLSTECIQNQSFYFYKIVHQNTWAQL